MVVIMRLQSSCVKGDPIWRMKFDKENLETKESLNRHDWVYNVILHEQCLFNIIFTCDWGVGAGGRNNLVHFCEEDWQETVMDCKSRRLGSGRDARLWTPGFLCKESEA